ncbi:MAG: hypothetical protein ABIH23_09785 [bacterium]
MTNVLNCPGSDLMRVCVDTSSDYDYSNSMRAISLISFCFCCGYLSLGTVAESDPATQERIERLEKENAELRGIIENLRQRLDAVEKQIPVQPKVSDIPSMTEPKPLKELEKRVETLEDLEEKHEKGWTRSLRRKWLEIGGELQLEYRDTQKETDSPAGMTADPYGQFQIDHMRLSPRVRFTDDLILEADFDAGQQATSDLQEVYLLWKNLPLDSEFTIGQQKKFFRPKRKTESYPLAGTAFWHDRDLGVTWRGEVDPFYAYASVMNGLRLHNDEIGEDESFPIVGDDLDDLKASEDKEVGLGLGWKGKSKDWGELDLMLFGLWDELSKDDRQFLSRLPGYRFLGDGDDRNRYGANMEYQLSGWNLFSQYITSEDGALERDTWYAQTSYKIKSKLKYLQSIEPLIRYGELNLDIDPFPTNSMLWDRQQWTLALIFEILEDISLRTEYTINEEDTGDGDIRNNEALIQLELRF